MCLPHIIYHILQSVLISLVIRGFMLMSIILLINYSLYLPNTYLHIPIFNFSYLIFYISFISLIFCLIYLNFAPPRLAMLFVVCSYTIFIFIFVYVNKDLLLLISNRYNSRVGINGLNCQPIRFC